MREQITKREIDTILRDIRVASHPHMKDEEARPFVESLVYKRRWMEGLDAIELDAEPDHAGIARFKDRIKKTSRNIAVK